MGKAIIIEFAGISCSGKSTAFSRIFDSPIPITIENAEDVLNRYYINCSKGNYFFLVLPHSIVKALILAWVHIKNIKKYKMFYFLCVKQALSGNVRLKAFRSFFFKFGKFLLLKDINTKITLMDEGVVQLLFSLFVRSSEFTQKSNLALLKILKYSPMPDEVVFGPVHPVNTIVSRMTERGHHRVTNGNYKPSVIESRANTFTSRSIVVQKKIICELKEKISLISLSDVTDWTNIIDRYRGDLFQVYAIN